MAPIALLSVSNKNGLISLAECLEKIHGFKLISSGGTARELEKAGINVQRVSEYTNAPEILGGRVKTLHPRVHGGILAKKNDSSHQKDLKEQEIPFIDLVVVNLYPFKETIQSDNVTWSEAIENIDIGGPAMIRAAAKNHEHVAVLTSPKQYPKFMDLLENGIDNITPEIRKELALEAFEHTASYDIAISNWLGSSSNSPRSNWIQEIPHKQTLRYGENPHQHATWYGSSVKGWGGAKQLQGKELSTNNLLDLEAAISTVSEFGYNKSDNQNCAAVVIKHTNPCGVAINKSISEALRLAIEGDSISAFGGIVALNSTVDVSTAKILKSLFLECVVSPSFTKEAQTILSDKSNLRLLELNPELLQNTEIENFRSILGGVLVQEKDNQPINTSNWDIVTKRKPSDQEVEDLTFAWKIVRHVRSNAITVASSGQSLGIGAGQMNRIASAKLALDSASSKANDAVLASDGFFPFDDTVRLAAQYGIKAIIQPGGSIKDASSINACDELDLAMIFTNKRHFLH